MKNERILVVDDDEMLLSSLVHIIESQGYQTSVAQTGKDALKIIKEQFFNLILLDIRLPDMTGIELLSLIKDSRPIMKKIILTGFPDASTAIDALNRKADAYLIKPFDPIDLLNQIEIHINQQKEELKYTQEKVLEYIQLRVKELDQTENPSTDVVSAK
ncbi:MAG: response regulator [Promethearchaeota archaeon]|jgi:DNA-binding response OmpR family regulator